MKDKLIELLEQEGTRVKVDGADITLSGPWNATLLEDTKVEEFVNRPSVVTPAESGLSLDVLYGPEGMIKDNDWPCIRYTVALKYKGKKFIETAFHLGVGHVDPSKVGDPLLKRWEMNLSEPQASMLMSWKHNRFIQFVNKEMFVDLAAKLAKYQKVVPELDMVCASLLLDGSAHFNHQSFEEWAQDYGYDIDSRKAEWTYKECLATGIKLAGVIPQDTLTGLLEWAESQ